ncbi:hypothetical protein QQS21_008522 [Conoideocrella luteorostrata]|uniref:Uncharacterized protein n=1 Tax=Conoideocrella luteorostrata TaxID=1105319 RepID=A0AAJ0CIQ5_9HYPO|nr:hypothetical protein QQS21_008522 [Conoideocrella luteorostrata]
MATLLAPYNTAMQLGTGFNSFTQQICIHDAVTSVKEPTSTVTDTAEVHKPVAQDVVYKTSIVDKVTDVTNEMNVNAAFAIKYDSFDAKGKVGFLNTSKVKEADVTFLISVKVVNQVIYDHSLLNLQPVEGIDPKNFVEVYGDSFVSGYQEGGTFTAVISVKSRNENKSRDMKLDAKIKFTQKKEMPKERTDEESKNLGLGINLSKEDMSFLDENETTISVSYTGGGQELKSPDEDWTFETMRNAALRFPSLVAKTPMRTHAILTKYTALRSYHAHFGGLKIPAFEMAGVYSTILQEAYLDFKTVAKNLQVLAYNVSAGQTRLIAASEARKKLEQASKPAASAGGDGDETASTTKDNTPASDAPESSQPVESDPHSNGNRGSKKLEDGPHNWAPIVLTREYPPTLQGLEDARSMVRTMLIRIVQEINILTKFPEAATDEQRVQPHMSPFLFKEFLPVGEPTKKESQDEDDLGPLERQMAKMKASGGRQGF